MNASVYVGNLAAPQITPEMLRSIFGCIGAIEDVRIGKTGRYAFVDFRDPKCAVLALGLNGTIVGGEPLLVEQTKSKPGGPEMGFPGSHPRSSRPYGYAAPYAPHGYSPPNYARPPYFPRGPPPGDWGPHGRHGPSEGPSYNLRPGQLPTPTMVFEALNLLCTAVKSGMNPVQMATATGNPVDPDLQDFIEKMSASVQRAKRAREDDEAAQSKRLRATEDADRSSKTGRPVSGDAQLGAEGPVAKVKTEGGSANGDDGAAVKPEVEADADAMSDTSEERSERNRRRRDMDAEEDD